ncbi:hypothetical protein Trydic_g5765 [Trypoxylus dichotomus]
MYSKLGLWYPVDVANIGYGVRLWRFRILCDIKDVDCWNLNGAPHSSAPCFLGASGSTGGSSCGRGSMLYFILYSENQEVTLPSMVTNTARPSVKGQLHIENRTRNRRYSWGVLMEHKNAHTQLHHRQVWVSPPIMGDFPCRMHGTEESQDDTKNMIKASVKDKRLWLCR